MGFIMDKKLENRIARLENLLNNSKSKPTLEQRIARLEKLLSKKVHNEARAPKSIGDAMVNAIFKGDANKVMSLLDAGADPNCQNRAGMTALFAAVNCHEHAIAKALLEAGADPNTSITTVGVDWYGDDEDIEEETTPLSAAKYDDDDRMVALLKRYGAR